MTVLAEVPLAPTTFAAGGAATDSRSLDALLIATAAGSETAFAELFRLVEGQLTRLVRAILIDSSQTEEVCQEALLEVWRLAHRFDPSRGPALSWILMTARARAVDRVRACQSSKERDTNYALRMWERPNDSTSAASERNVEKTLVGDAFAKLSQVQREAAHLFYFGDKSQAQIAEHLSIPLGTVKTRLRDAVIKLRIHMSDERTE